MPLTEFQAEVLRVIAANRSIASHVAGAALNATENSARYSEDNDIFHDVEEAARVASETDCGSLLDSGFAVERQLWEPSCRRAWVEQHEHGVKVEWAHNAVWRFFPVESDPILGWRLHPFDALTNKALAMGARAETRDLVDLVTYADRYRLAAIIWAACGKDPGWTPLSLLDQMRRNARIDLAALNEMRAAIEPTTLKSLWLALAGDAESEILTAAKLGLEIGVAFLDEDQNIAWHTSPGSAVHRATIGGIVPRLPGLRYDLPNS